MKRLLRCMVQVRSLLPVLALLLSLPKTAFPLFFAYGRCFNYDGTSGTASDAPSYASLAVYRHGLDQEVGRQNGSGNPHSDDALYEASGGLPAYFLSDVDTFGQWTTAPALGQAVVAVLECRPGQFGWTGPALQAWSKHVLGPGDLGASTADMGSFTLQLLPQLTALASGPGSVELSWTAPADPLGLISSYTVYRASFPAPGPQYRYPKTSALPDTAKIVNNQVSFTDNPPLGPLWRYRVAANFIWEPEMPGDDFDGGAIPDKDYYVAFGQSEEVLAPGTPTETPSPSPIPPALPTATMTPTPSLIPPSATSTPTPAPPAATATPSPMPTKARHAHGRPRLGPVPARRGDPVCLQVPGQASLANVELYTLSGEAAARVADAAQPCLATGAFAPGIYLARISLTLESGGVEVHWQKIALIP